MWCMKWHFKVSAILCGKQKWLIEENWSYTELTKSAKACIILYLFIVCKCIQLYQSCRNVWSRNQSKAVWAVYPFLIFPNIPALFSTYQFCLLSYIARIKCPSCSFCACMLQYMSSNIQRMIADLAYLKFHREEWLTGPPLAR